MYKEAVSLNPFPKGTARPYLGSRFRVLPPLFLIRLVMKAAADVSTEHSWFPHVVIPGQPFRGSGSRRRHHRHRRHRATGGRNKCHPEHELPVVQGVAFPGSPPRDSPKSRRPAVPSSRKTRRPRKLEELPPSPLTPLSLSAHRAPQERKLSFL